MEGGDERAGVKRRYPFEVSASRTDRAARTSRGWRSRRRLLRANQAFAMHDRRVGKSLANWLVVTAIAPGDVVRVVRDPAAVKQRMALHRPNPDQRPKKSFGDGTR